MPHQVWTCSPNPGSFITQVCAAIPPFFLFLNMSPTGTDNNHLQDLWVVIMKIMISCRIVLNYWCFLFYLQMAQQGEPLYDFPEPSKSSQCKLLAHQRGRGSLRSISVLDRLLLTVPVWLQLSINAATALHILQREPPGVRNSQQHTLTSNAHVQVLYNTSDTRYYIPVSYLDFICCVADLPCAKVSYIPEKCSVCSSGR